MLSRVCLSVLGAAQIDKYGNLNSTWMKDNFLIGSGGANDAANAREVVIVASQSRQRLCQQVDYITCPGRNVTVLVTTKGIFEKSSPHDEFILTSLFPDDKLSGSEAKIANLQESCGWELKISPDLLEILPPSDEELGLLRWLDPQGHFRIEKEAKRL